MNNQDSVHRIQPAENKSGRLRLSEARSRLRFIPPNHAAQQLKTDNDKLMELRDRIAKLKIAFGVK